MIQRLTHRQLLVFDQRLWRVVWITWQLSITPSPNTETNLTDNWEVYLHCGTWFNMFSSVPGLMVLWDSSFNLKHNCRIAVFIRGLKSLCQSKMACCACHFHNSSRESSWAQQLISCELIITLFLLRCCMTGDSSAWSCASLISVSAHKFSRCASSETPHVRVKRCSRVVMHRSVCAILDSHQLRLSRVI